jgi:dolichol-phosphate mannosyltransferase
VKRISIVTPMYNEASNVEELQRRLADVFDCYVGIYDFEVIAVENGSLDETYPELLAARGRDARWKIIQLSRNFDMEGGMSAGLAAATGDAAVIMAADLQDPPEIIPLFIEQWEAGFENVYGVITQRSDESAFRRFAAATFYRIINRVSDRPVPRNASDFRLVDRAAYEAFNRLPERNRMVRAMWGWLGFRSIGVEHARPPRHGGVSNFQTLRTAAFALRAILASSYAPLKFIPFFGLALAVLSFALLFGEVVRALAFGVPFDGYGTIVGIMLLCFGFLFLLLGLVSEYVAMIFEEVRRRPSFVVRARHGFDPFGAPTAVYDLDADVDRFESVHIRRAE